MSESEKKSSGEGGFTGLGDLRRNSGSRRRRRRVGRGVGTGLGKTSGRGHKGQKSRSGYSRTPGFEGGQMPLQRRLPKRGFRKPFPKEFSEVNLRHLGKFDPGASLDTAALRAAGVVRRVRKNGVKILGVGTVDKPFHLKVQGCSESARRKIEGAGGSVEIVPLAASGGEEKA